MIDIYLDIGREEKVGLLRWYAKQSELVQIDIHNDKRGILNRNRETFIGHKFKLSEIDFASLILAIRRLKHLMDSLERKGRVSENELDRISRLRIEETVNKPRRPQKKEKAKKVKLYFVEIEKLREHGASWRNIALHLSKHRSFSVSHTYLRKEFMVLQRKKQLDTLLKERGAHETN